MTLNPLSNDQLHSLRLKDTVVIRGRVTSFVGDYVQRQLVFDDHVPNRALRLVKAYIWQQSEKGMTQSSAIGCTVSSQNTLVPFFAADNYDQIAWITSGRATTVVGQKDYNDIIDPTNLISHQAFATFWHEGTLEELDINYMFIFQRVDLDDTDALIVTLNNYIS